METTNSDHAGPIGPLLYCGSEGLGAGDLILGLLRGTAGLPDWPQFRDRTVVPTFLGRTAVWQLCRIWNLGPGDEILMPAYNCGTEADPFIVAGCRVTLYRVDEHAQIDVQDIVRRRSERTKVVYVTHYFGWAQKLDELLPWCRREGLRLVEDCALALFSHGPQGPLGTLGDAAIFSLGKFLPVPAGGVLTLRRETGLAALPLEKWPQKETFTRASGLFRKDAQRKLEWVRLYSPLRRLKMRREPRRQHRLDPPSLGVEDGTPDLPPDYYLDSRLRDKAMPPMSAGIARGAGASVTKRRRANYVELARNLASIECVKPLFSDLPDGVVPMAFPALSAHRRELVELLESHGICSYPFWEGYHRRLDWSEFPEARMLKDKVLTLPVNQSLSSAHMRFIASVISNAEGSLALQVQAKRGPAVQELL